MIAESISTAQSVWDLVRTVRGLVGADVVSALFKYDGTRVEGSDKIVVELHPLPANPAVWWYSVTALDDYVFVRAPVNPTAAIEQVGTVVGEAQPDARYWRWIAPVLPGRIYGGTEPPTLRVDFVVFGYRPKALLKLGSPGQ